GEWVERFRLQTGQVTERSRTRPATFTAEGLSKDGRSAVTVTVGGEAGLLSGGTGEVLGRVEPNGEGSLRARVGANGRQVAVTSLSEGRKVWDIETGKLVAADLIRWPRDPFYLSPDGRHALVNGKRLVLRDLFDAVPARDLAGLPFAPESYGQTVWQWD